MILAPAAFAQQQPPTKDVTFEQRLGETVPMDVTFHDETGTTITFGNLLKDKPAVLVLGYQRCPKLCAVVLANLVERLRNVSFEVGKDFSVIDLSIDPREDPEMGRVAQTAAVERYGRGTTAGWHFLTGREESIRAVANAVGFRYRYDREKREFEHPSGVILLTPDGKVARYLFGIEYRPSDLRLGLVEASQGTISSPVDRVLLLLCNYDPQTGRYTPLAMGILRGAAIVTVLIVGFFLVSRHTNLFGRKG
jgi:protein SCO1/2